MQFTFAIWCLWRHRNNVVFDNAPANPNLHLMCIQLARQFFYCVSKRQKTRYFSVNPVCWLKLDHGWYKLNSAEFWALRDGLMLAAQLGIDHLLVELDAQIVVNLVISKKKLLTTHALLCSMIAGTSWSGSSVSKSPMCLGRRIYARIILLERAVLFLELL